CAAEVAGGELVSGPPVSFGSAAPCVGDRGYKRRVYSAARHGHRLYPQLQMGPAVGTAARLSFDWVQTWDVNGAQTWQRASVALCPDMTPNHASTARAWPVDLPGGTQPRPCRRLRAPVPFPTPRSGSSSAPSTSS